LTVFPGGDKLFGLHRPLGHGRGFFSRQRNRFRILFYSVGSTNERWGFRSGQIHFHGSPSLGRGELPFGKPSSSPTEFFRFYLAARLLREVRLPESLGWFG